MTTGRWQWSDLPVEARVAVATQVGAVFDTESAPPGLTVGVASRLATETGGFFLKAIPLRSPARSHYERERAVNRALPDKLGPRLLWSGEAGGWLLMLFELIADARPTDLDPGSPDVPSVLATVRCLNAELTPNPWPDAPCITQRLEDVCEVVADPMLFDTPDDPGVAACADAVRRIDFDAFVGDTLLHTDLHEGNLLVAAGEVWVIDWSLACHGAAWVEVAKFLPRLIAAGHTPAQADAAARHAPAWKDAPDGAATSLVALVGLFAHHMASVGPATFAQKRQRTAGACIDWVLYRSGRATQ